jgi:dimethylargininase
MRSWNTSTHFLRNKFSMRVFDFTHAIVREPGKSVARGLRSDPALVPDFDTVRAEHAAYVSALERAGLSVDALSSLESFPDSMFVEDPALVLPEGAILLRPGASTRLGEAEEIRPELLRHFASVAALGEGEYVDGGDVLVTPQTIFIGMSRRTNLAGAVALEAILAQLARDARIVETPPGALHFKTSVSLLSEDTLLATPQMAASGLFAGMKTLLVPDDEEAAANALRINNAVLAGECFPRTVDLLAREGFAVTTLPVTEIGKLDAGLSCMSLRWYKQL